MADRIEQGDIYFFYRQKMDRDSPENLSDLARFYVMLLPDEQKQGRLMLVGKKRMPKIMHGKSKSTSKEWLMTYKVDAPQQLVTALHPVTYTTKTKGERREPAAVPAGAGRYAIGYKDDDTYLSFRLDLPERRGDVQKELGILREGSYVISIRNPDLEVPGFPDEHPDYPKSTKEKFADKRWLGVEDAKMLNYEKVQLLLIGASDSADHVPFKLSGKSSIYKQLGLKDSEWPLDALQKGRFEEINDEPEAVESEGDRSKGGRRGGAKARQTSSAAGVAAALKGIDFPQKTDDVADYARKNGANKEVVDLLEHLPKKRRFESMADVQKAVGEVR